MKNTPKKLLKFIPTLFLFALCLTLSSIPAQAKMSKKKQHKLYAPVMKKYAKVVKSIAAKNESADYYKQYYKVRYKFVDIDKNGIDECIMRYTQNVTNTAKGSGYGETTTIYTIRNGKVKAVVNKRNWDPHLHDEFIHIYKGSKYIDKGWSSGGEDDHNFYKMSKGKIPKKATIVLSHAIHEDWYYINNKKVSKAKYMKKYKALTNNGKGYSLKVYK